MHRSPLRRTQVRNILARDLGFKLPRVSKSGCERGERDARAFPRAGYLFWTNKQTAVFSRQSLVEGDEKRREERASTPEARLVLLNYYWIMSCRERLFVPFLSQTAETLTSPRLRRKGGKGPRTEKKGGGGRDENEGGKRGVKSVTS